MMSNWQQLARTSWRWPSPDSWHQAGKAFDEASASFELAVEVERLRREDGAHIQSTDGDRGSDGPAGVPVGADAMVLWQKIGREGAPTSVRENAWLLVAWATWCVKKEEPALLWLGAFAAALLAITGAYPIVRWAVALAMRAMAA